jgi:hypothetical protein
MMCRQTQRPVRAIALLATLIVSGVGIGVPTDSAYTDDCLVAPNSPAPPGNHWYFRIDGEKKRKCWYFRAVGQSGQQAVAQATSASAPLARLQSIKTQSAPKAAPAASASMSTSPGGSTPPSNMPDVKPHSDQMISATSESDVERNEREASSESISQAVALPTPQADVSNPTPMITALDTTLEADVERSGREGSSASIPQELASQESATPKVITPTENTGVVSVRPRADGQASDNAENTAKGLFQILRCHGCMSLLFNQLHTLIAPDHRWKMTGKGALVLSFLIFGLAVAGTIPGVAMKVVSGRRDRVIVDHSEPNLIEGQFEHERRDDQHQQEWEGYQQQSDSTNNFLTERIQSSTARSRNSAPEAAEPPGGTSRSSTLGLSDAPLLQEWPFLRGYTLPGLPNEEAFTYFYFEGRSAVVGRRSADVEPQQRPA